MTPFFVSTSPLVVPVCSQHSLRFPFLAEYGQSGSDGATQCDETDQPVGPQTPKQSKEPDSVVQGAERGQGEVA